MEMKSFFANNWLLLLIGLIALICIAFVAGKIQMNRQISREVALIMGTGEENTRNESAYIEKEDLEHLPEPVQKWLEIVGVVGQERIQTAVFSQRGKMRLSPEQENWMEPEAKQFVRVDRPSYLWHVDLPMIPFINTKGRDLFHNGQGSMQIRIGSLIPVVNAHSNEKLDESSLHRFLLELPWYPTAALEDYMSWEKTNDHQAKGILSYEGITVEALFFFSSNGDLEKMESMRYKDNDEKAERIPCIGEIKGSTEVDGMRIPHQIDVTWLIDGEPFTWYKLQNENIRFNQ